MGEREAHPFPIVGVGASAGGLEPLRELLSGLPPRPGLAIVVIQHLAAHQDSQLASLLQLHTALPVDDANHGRRVQPDHVYVIQPNTQVALVDGILSVTARPEGRHPHYPIDHFLRSLAAVQGPYGVGVILSGTGSDGTLGLAEIKAAGGVSFAQDAASAQYGDMPHRAITSGVVDLVLPPREIAARIGAWRDDPVFRDGASGSAPLEQDDQFTRVLDALRKTSGVDFSEYRDTTIKRRAARRMLLRGFKGPAEYAQLVEEDRSEAEALFRDVLINVTSFFRDPGMFEALKEEVFPAIMAERQDNTPLRVWIPGCSTGQETYSVAIALIEFLETARVQRTIQIFGTDVAGGSSLDQARSGVYPESIEADVSPERLRRFFVKEQRTYRILREVRELCVFAPQNVAADPPFSRVDLVTCRNMLIYMSATLQERLLPVFHFALNKGGFLVLGTAETVGTSDLFELTNRTHKIYRKREVSRRPPLTFMADAWLAGMTAARPALPASSPMDFQREADRQVLNRYAPPSVLVNQQFEIQHFRGRTSPFLEAPAGQPTTNILRMAKEGLFLELQSALAESKASKAPVIREDLRVIDQGADVAFTLRVLPLSSPSTTDLSFLVLFETSTPPWVPPPAADLASVAASDRDVEWLRRELMSSRQYLQTVIDQHASITQDLRAAHEEVLSSNEELKSTNEELETTKEELQSTNEELTTVNEQFLNRNRELDALTDELSNFIRSADLPMVTVGRDLRIRRLTPAAERAFNLLPSDVGRSIDHIKFALAVDQIGPEVERVITTLKAWDQEVTDRDGRAWLLRVQPYRTADGHIDGATIVAVDIEVVKRNQQLTEERDYAQAIVQTVREPLAVLDGECRVGTANTAFYALFQTSEEQVRGRMLWDSNPAVWADASVRQPLLAICGGAQSVTNFEIDRILPNRGRRILSLNATPIVRAGRPTLLLLAVEDVTASREAETWLRQTDRRKDEFLGILAHELRNPLGPMRFALELLQQKATRPEDTAKFLRVLDRQVTHMVRIIDDLVDVSRITQGKLELRLETVNLATVVKGAVELSRPAIETAKHTFKVSLPAESVLLRADPVRLTQMLVNVLNNAVKFTPPGGHIYLLVETAGDAPDLPSRVSIRIRDDGIGIAPELQPKIFEMFAQGDRSLERTRSGLGVGLTLVRNLAQLHGGSIDVRSEGVDTGTEVVIDLPILASPQPAPAIDESTEAPLTRPLRILIAEDHADARETMRLFLESEGHTVLAVADGSMAVSSAEKFQPDVAILDISMPGMNGYRVAEELRRMCGPGSPALIALSGLGQDKDKRKAMETGFELHFTKPVDARALANQLALISQRDSTGTRL